METVVSGSPKPQSRNPQVDLRDLYDARGAEFYPTTAFEIRLTRELLQSTRMTGGPTGMLESLQDKAGGSEFRRSRSEEHARAAGEAAVISTLNSYGDFLGNSISSLIKLREAKSLIDTSKFSVSPRDSLSRGIVREDQSLLDFAAPLVRFAVLHDFASHGNMPKGFNPLKTEKNRNNPSLWRYSSRKRIEDPFTSHTRSDQVDVFMQNFLTDTPLAVVGRLIPRAIDDQEKRAKFWLRGLRAAPERYKRPAKLILDIVSTAKE